MTFVSIHDTARVHETARLGPGVIIGPNVYIAEHVVIGAYSVIGGTPEHSTFRRSDAGRGVRIGRRVRIHEHVTIHSGVEGRTVIQRCAWIFNHVHIGHDARVCASATVAAGALLGGHSVVMPVASVGAGACLHPFAVVGAYGYLGAKSYLRWAVEPGMIYSGNPARKLGWNDVGLEREGVLRKECRDWYMGGFEAWKKRAKERFRKSIAASSPAS